MSFRLSRATYGNHIKMVGYMKEEERRKKKERQGTPNFKNRAYSFMNMNYKYCILFQTAGADAQGYVLNENV